MGANETRVVLFKLAVDFQTFVGVSLSVLIFQHWIGMLVTFPKSFLKWSFIDKSFLKARMPDKCVLVLFVAVIFYSMDSSTIIFNPFVGNLFLHCGDNRPLLSRNLL